MIRQPECKYLTRLTVKTSIRSSLLPNIIQQKPLQVNHQFDAQPEKQKREAFQTSRFSNVAKIRPG